MRNSQVEIKPLAANCGATIHGIDLNLATDEDLDKVRQAVYHYGVVTLPQQELEPASQIRLAERFGTPEPHKIAKGLDDFPLITRVHKAAGDAATFGVGWHTDNSFQEQPTSISILSARTLPPVGGDTLYANQYLAYEDLSVGMKRMLDGLVGVHSAKYAFTVPTAQERYGNDDATISYEMNDIVFAEVEHPVVRTHPGTGVKALYVNPMFTIRFKDMTEAESKPLLNFLFEQCTRPELQCRVQWSARAVTLWDNRCVQHYAMDDYRQYERILDRITVQGEKPV
jgi:taurine dioxygenase